MPGFAQMVMPAPASKQSSKVRKYAQAQQLIDLHKWIEVQRSQQQKYGNTLKRSN